MSASTTTRFGTLFRKFRKQAGLSQQQLADYLAESPKRVSKWETGVSDPPGDPAFYESLRNVPGFTESDITLLQRTAEADKSTETARELLDQLKATLERLKNPQLGSSTEVRRKGFDPYGTHLLELTSEPLAQTLVEVMTMYAELALRELGRLSTQAPQALPTTGEEAPEILTESSYKDDLIRLWGSEKGANPVQTLVRPEGSSRQGAEQEVQTSSGETTQSPRKVRREYQRAHESLEQTHKRLLRKYGEDQFIITAHRVYEDAKGIQYQAMAKNVPVKYVSIGQAAEESQIANQTLATWVADGLLHNVTKVEQPSKSESGIVLVEPREVMKLKEKLEVGTEAAEPKLITLVEAAKKYELPYGTVRSWYRRGHLPEKGREVFGTHGGGKILVDEKEVIRLKSQPPARGKPPIKLTE
jgi:transcriptional regulator with XRE-family HTH domain